MCALAVQLHFNFDSVIGELWMCIKKKHSKDSPSCCFRLVVSMFLFFSFLFSFGPSFYLWSMLRRRRAKKNDCCECHCHYAEAQNREKNNEWNELIGHWEFRRYSFTIFFFFELVLHFFYICVCLFHCPFSTRALFLIDLVKVSSMPANCALLSCVCVCLSFFVQHSFSLSWFLMSASFLNLSSSLYIFRMSSVVMQKPQHIYVYNGIELIYSYNIYFTFQKIPIARQMHTIYERLSIPLIGLSLKESTTMMMMINVTRMMSEQKWKVQWMHTHMYKPYTFTSHLLMWKTGEREMYPKKNIKEGIKIK